MECPVSVRRHCIIKSGSVYFTKTNFKIQNFKKRVCLYLYSQAFQLGDHVATTFRRHPVHRCTIRGPTQEEAVEVRWWLVVSNERQERRGGRRNGKLVSNCQECYQECYLKKSPASRTQVRFWRNLSIVYIHRPVAGATTGSSSLVSIVAADGNGKNLNFIHCPMVNLRI